MVEKCPRQESKRSERTFLRPFPFFKCGIPLKSPLDREFFARETTRVAKELLGTVLVSEIGEIRTCGRIVETEAYLPERDSACHAAKYRTARTEVMFGPAGYAYVYPIHAKHCFNIVTELEERGSAVLIRALEPLDGISMMQARRGQDQERRLTTGPACLCQALGIDRSHNQVDLSRGKTIWLEPGIGLRSSRDIIKSSQRIGVTTAKTRRLRFYVAGNHFVSGPAKMRD